jgi:hypothetical protein
MKSQGAQAMGIRQELPGSGNLVGKQNDDSEISDLLNKSQPKRLKLSQSEGLYEMENKASLSSPSINGKLTLLIATFLKSLHFTISSDSLVDSFHTNI